MSASNLAGGAAPDRRDMFQFTLLIVSVILAIGMNAGFTLWSVQRSQHQWCSALVTLDNADQHSPAPATEAGKHLFSDFHSLRESFGCG